VSYGQRYPLKETSSDDDATVAALERFRFDRSCVGA